MADELDDTIEESAKAPKTVVVDGRQVTGRDVREQIEADKYLAGKKAAKRGPFFTQIVPPGST